MEKPLRNRETRETVIGALAVTVLAVVLGWSYFGEPMAAAGQDEAFVLTAEFGRIDGLVVGDPVYVSGVAVGSVAELRLAPDFRAVATFRFDRRVALPVDTSAVIHTDGLFGSKFVLLDPGGASRDLESGDRIRYTQDAMIVSKLLDLIISQGRAARAAQPGGE